MNTRNFISWPFKSQFYLSNDFRHDTGTFLFRRFSLANSSLTLGSESVTYQQYSCRQRNDLAWLTATRRTNKWKIKFVAWQVCWSCVSLKCSIVWNYWKSFVNNCKNNILLFTNPCFNEKLAYHFYPFLNSCFHISRDWFENLKDQLNYCSILDFLKNFGKRDVEIIKNSTCVFIFCICFNKKRINIFNFQVQKKDEKVGISGNESLKEITTKLDQKRERGERKKTKKEEKGGM